MGGGCEQVRRGRRQPPKGKMANSTPPPTYTEFIYENRVYNPEDETPGETHSPNLCTPGQPIITHEEGSTNLKSIVLDKPTPKRKGQATQPATHDEQPPSYDACVDPTRGTTLEPTPDVPSTQDCNNQGEQTGVENGEEGNEENNDNERGEGSNADSDEESLSDSDEESGSDDEDISVDTQSVDSTDGWWICTLCSR